MPVSRHTGLAIRRFRPLSHLSGVDLGAVSGKPRRRGEYSRKTTQIQGQLIAACAAEHGVLEAPLFLGRLRFVNVETSVTVRVEATKNRKRAEEFAQRHFTVMVAIHPLEPDGSFARRLRRLRGLHARISRIA